MVERLLPVLAMKLIDTLNEESCIPLNKDFTWDSYDYFTAVEFPSECTVLHVEAPVMDTFPKPIVGLKVILRVGQ